MTTEIIFNTHPSLIGGFVAWNHMESEVDKHLIIAEGETFEDLAVSVRAGVALAWTQNPTTVPLMVCLRQATAAPEVGVLQGGGDAKNLVGWLANYSSPAKTKKGGNHIAIEGLGPLRGLLVCPEVPLKPETTLFIARTVRNWIWDLRDPACLELYSSWLKAKD